MDRIEMIDALEDILSRLTQLHCLMDMLCVATEQATVPADALYGINDLLEAIYLKFRADIDFIDIAVSTSGIARE